MKLSRNIWVTVTACVVSVLTIIFWCRTKEPVYQGKSLHVWLEQSTAGGPMAAADTKGVEAIRQIGTNALPTLLKMAQVTDSRLTSACIKVVRAQSVIHFHIHTDEEYHAMACVGFYALGPLGKAAVPDLIALLNRTKEQIHGVAADCLGHIGPDAEQAVPSLIHFINDPNRIVRWDIILNLSKIRSHPELAVPALMAKLSPTNDTLLYATISALGPFGENARPAVPVLLTFLTNADGGIRYAATNAIRAIAPEAAVKAGLK